MFFIILAIQTSQKYTQPCSLQVQGYWITANCARVWRYLMLQTQLCKWRYKGRPCCKLNCAWKVQRSSMLQTQLCKSTSLVPRLTLFSNALKSSGSLGTRLQKYKACANSTMQRYKAQVTKVLYAANSTVQKYRGHYGCGNARHSLLIEISVAHLYPYYAISKLV